jgi:hypothetical protein
MHISTEVELGFVHKECIIQDFSSIVGLAFEPCSIFLIPDPKQRFMFSMYAVEVKGKVVRMLNLIKHYAMKAYGGVDV